MSVLPIDPSRRLRALLPLALLPVLLAALYDPVFRDTADIDDLWEVGCLAVAGAGIAVRMLLAAAGRLPGLQTTGLHSVVRHPLALGNSLVWLGLSAFPRSWPALLVCLLVLWLAYRPRMALQDAALRERFGPAFDAWAQRTPAFVPAWSQWRPSAAPSSWPAALLRESSTVFATVAAFFLLEVAGDVIVGEPLQLEPEWALLLAAATAFWIGTRLAFAQRVVATPSAPSPWAAVASSRWEALAVAAFCLVAWDASGADLAVARWAGGAQGFPWRDTWLASTLLHDDLRLLAWAGVGWLAIALRWPAGPLRGLAVRERTWLLATVLLSILVVSSMKHWSLTSCPWDIEAFGGAAHYVSHWHWGAGDGGPGHCFPAGHASGGFAFIAGAFALRRNRPAAARAWLAAALAVGVLMGLGQQLRGAHFTSHTLWSAWICWACAQLSAAAFLRHNPRP